MAEVTPPYGHRTQRPPDVPDLDVLWLTAGLSCDGDTVSITAATQPSLEDVLGGALPGLPRVRLHNAVLAYEVGDRYLGAWHAAAEGRLGRPFLLVVEGSIPDERNHAEGCWAGFGTDRATGQPIPTCWWIDRLAPRAWAVVAAGTCAAYGGVHAMAGNPTGARGLPDYLGWGWRSRAGAGPPIVCVPGCPVQPDNFMEVLLYLLSHAAGTAPMIPLDEQLRPRWLFERTVHEGCDRAGYYEQADFAERVGSPKCIVKLGCWGPVVQCNVGKRGWMDGIGGCANVGGVCIGCTMPGFPDKFLQPSFLAEPPGAVLSSTAADLLPKRPSPGQGAVPQRERLLGDAEARVTYGTTVRALRAFTRASMNNREPEGRTTPLSPPAGEGGRG
jgi:hydrogenase small subunit